ncbi:SDR family oxidoreductase [bacterium]|nr:SDR family oxidoreductase [bacterium]
MRRDLSGKRVIVTGSSSGIGRALAMELARRGSQVALAARSIGELDQVAEDIRQKGGQALVIPTDVTSPHDRQQLFETVQQQWGGLDILVNNAGIAAHGHFIDLDPSILRQTMELNFFAMAENCRLAIPMLAEGHAPMIVNVSSMAGRRGVPAWSEYSASKFAVCGFSEALRAELVRFGIDLMLVVPGLTHSNFGKHLLARKGRMPARFDSGLAPEVVGRLMANGMEKGKHELRMEKDARLLLFINWLAPRFVDWRMGNVVRKLYQREIADQAKTPC